MSEDTIPSELVFDDLPPQTVPVTIGKIKYVLREASEADAVEYRNCMMRGSKIVDGKVAAIDNLAQAQPTLVSRCLYFANLDGTLQTTPNGEPNPKTRVPYATVLKWKSRVVKPIFELLKKISALNEEETKDTVESLTKRIETDTKKLEELQASQSGKETDGPLEPSSESMETT
jgi:hypothetical protein